MSDIIEYIACDDKSTFLFFSLESELPSTPASHGINMPVLKTDSQLEFHTFPINESNNLDMQLLKIICKEFKPFSIVEDKEFTKFVNMLNPDYVMPTRKTLSGILLPAMYAELKEKVMADLNAAESVGLTTDCWTSINNTMYIALKAHYIIEHSSSLKLKSSLLGCCHFAEHTIINIPDSLMAITNEWQISKKISGIVTDNTASMVGAARLLNWTPVSCFAHSLNLAVQASMLELGGLVSKVKAIVQYFKQNKHVAYKLIELQKQMGLPIVKLKLDLLNRWSTTFDMLNRFHRNQNSLISTLLVLNLNEKFRFSNEDWTTIEESVNILEIFNEVISELSSEKTVTISKLPILCNIILKSVRDMQVSTPAVINLKAKILHNFQIRFKDIETEQLVAQATILDPRFKKFGFSTNETSMKAINNIKILIKLSEKPVTSPQQFTEPAARKKSLWTEFDESTIKLTLQQNSEAEVDKFLNEPLLSRSKDPLQWWFERKAVYPALYPLVTKTLCVPATSVPPVRLFSKAGQIYNERRTRLKGNTVEEVIFLNENLN